MKQFISKGDNYETEERRATSLGTFDYKQRRKVIVEIQSEALRNGQGGSGLYQTIPFGRKEMPGSETEITPKEMFTNEISLRVNYSPKIRENKDDDFYKEE